MSSECMRAKSLQMCNLIQSTSPRGSSVHGFLQARILEWVAMPSSRGSSWPRDRTCISYVFCIGRRAVYPQRHLGSPWCPVADDYPKCRAWAAAYVAVNWLTWPWPTSKFATILTSGPIIYLNRCLHITGSYFFLLPFAWHTASWSISGASQADWKYAPSLPSRWLPPQQITWDWDFPGGPVVETLPSSAGGWGSVLGWGAGSPHALKPK